MLLEYFERDNQARIEDRAKEVRVRERNLIERDIKLNELQREFDIKKPNKELKQKNSLVSLEHQQNILKCQNQLFIFNLQNSDQNQFSMVDLQVEASLNINIDGFVKKGLFQVTKNLKAFKNEGDVDNEKRIVIDKLQSGREGKHKNCKKREEKCDKKGQPSEEFQEFKLKKRLQQQEQSGIHRHKAVKLLAI